MSNSEKLDMLKVFLNMDDAENNRLEIYLDAAEKEILSWKYSYASSVPTAVDIEDEMTQIYAVVAGYNLIGAENQKTHNENGISRTFKYSDMIQYIRSNVIPYARVAK